MNNTSVRHHHDRPQYPTNPSVVRHWSSSILSGRRHHSYPRICSPISILSTGDAAFCIRHQSVPKPEFDGCRMRFLPSCIAALIVSLGPASTTRRRNPVKCREKKEKKNGDAVSVRGWQATPITRILARSGAGEREREKE